MARERDLFANFERMRREIDELFGDVFEHRRLSRRREGFSPAVDVYLCGEPQRVIVKADLAGIDLDTLGLEVAGRCLIISGHRRPAEAEGRVYQQIEIEHGPFRREVELEADVDAGAASAAYEDGILRVELPLAAQPSSVRRVPVNAAGPTPGGDRNGF